MKDNCVGSFQNFSDFFPVVLDSELSHGTGKPMMVLYKDEGDFVVIAGVVVEERKVEGEMNRSIFKPRINARLIYLFKQIITLHSKFKIVKIIKNCQKLTNIFQKLSKIVKIVKTNYKKFNI